MAEYKCRSCGELLEVPQGAAVVVCPHCEYPNRAEDLQAAAARGAGAAARPALADAQALLQAGNFEAAAPAFEALLLYEPTSPAAYLGLLMAELRMARPEDLARHDRPLAGYSNYQMALRFADEGLRQQLEGYEQTIVTGIKEREYQSALQDMQKPLDEEAFLNLAQRFRGLGDYKNAAELAQSCNQYSQKAINERIAKERDTKQKSRKTSKILLVLVGTVVVFGVLVFVIYAMQNFGR